MDYESAGGATAFKLEFNAPFSDRRLALIANPINAFSYSPLWSIGIRGGVACGAASEGNMPMALRYRQYCSKLPRPDLSRCVSATLAGLPVVSLQDQPMRSHLLPTQDLKLRRYRVSVWRLRFRQLAAVDPRWGACGGATLDVNPRVGRSPSKPDPASGSPPSEATLDADAGCWPALRRICPDAGTVKARMRRSVRDGRRG